MSPHKSKTPNKLDANLGFIVHFLKFRFADFLFRSSGVGRAAPSGLRYVETLILKPGVLVSGSGAQILKGTVHQRRNVWMCAPRPERGKELKGTLKIDHRKRFFLSVRRELSLGLALKGPESLFHTS